MPQSDINRPREPSITVRRGRIRSNVRPPQAFEPRDPMVRGGIISGREIAEQTPLPPRPPPVGVDPRTVVDPGLYVPPDFAGDPSFIPILRIPGVDPDPPGSIPWLQRWPKISIQPGLRKLINIGRSPVLLAASLADLISTRGTRASLAEVFLCSEVLGARNRAECKIMLAAGVIGNMITRGIGLGPVGRFIKTQRGFVFPKPSKLKPARPGPVRRKGDTNVPLPFPGITPDDLTPGAGEPFLPLPGKRTSPDAVPGPGSPVPAPPAPGSPAPGPVRPDLLPGTPPPTVLPRPADLPVSVPAPLVQPSILPSTSPAPLSIPRPSLPSRSPATRRPRAATLARTALQLGFLELTRSLARQRVRAPVQSLVDLVGSTSPVGRVTPVRDPILSISPAFARQPLAQRARGRTADKDCVEVKRKRTRNKCREGFYTELRGRTRYTPWRTVDCVTGETIKELEK